MPKRTDEEKMLFDDYIAVTTIQRYFSLNKIDAQDIFIKAKSWDEDNGYLDIFPERVRKGAVLQVLGLNLESMLMCYQIKNKRTCSINTNGKDEYHE